MKRLVFIALSVAVATVGGVTPSLADERSVAATSQLLVDPASDNGPAVDARGDILRVGLTYSGGSITATVNLRGFDDPVTSAAWQSGPPPGANQTGLLWGLDVNGDLSADMNLKLQWEGATLRARLVPGLLGVPCDATPSTNPPSGGYSLTVPASCAGTPGAIRAYAFMTYTNFSGTSSDQTGWTEPVGPNTPSLPNGYWMLDSGGAVYAFGGVIGYGNAPTPFAVDLEPTPKAKGYWVLDGPGNVYAYGDAPHLGGAGTLAAGEAATSIARTTSGSGYWIFTNRGRVIARGDAVHYGDMSGVPLNGPVLDSIVTPTGLGYYMVGSDGGVFSFGDARFYGSMGGQRLNAPVMSLVPDGDGVGYWLVATDGGIFAFQAPFRGSMGSTVLNRPVTGMVRFGNGYLMVGEDGGIFNFSDQPFLGSLGSSPPPRPVVSAATPG